ncbi:hypothetical protein F5Y10DRAFT_255191 [Nemania abortiva]|nr:hypothetical protein F5Y10DRAFT_255191 [Nemania abortiva]
MDQSLFWDSFCSHRSAVWSRCPAVFHLPRDVDIETFFRPLPHASLCRLLASLPVEMGAPGTDCLCDWANPVIDACRKLTAIRDTLNRELQVDPILCAEFSEDSYFPVAESQRLLCRGESWQFDCKDSTKYPLWWRTVGLFYGKTDHDIPSVSPGAILIASYPQQNTKAEELCDTSILRAEILNLLNLLWFDMAQLRDKNEGLLCATAFLLSFTPTKVRALEAHVESSGGLSKVRIRTQTILDGAPTEAESRKEAFQKLVAWSMFTDTRIEASGHRPSSRASASSANTTWTTSVSSHSDEEVTTANTSFTEEKEKERENNGGL